MWVDGHPLAIVVMFGSLSSVWFGEVLLNKITRMMLACPLLSSFLSLLCSLHDGLI